MIKLLLFLNSILYGKNERNHYKYSNKILWVICNVGYRIIWVIFYYYMRLRGAFHILPHTNGKINEEVVVSLTSFPARIGYVWIVIDSLLRQKMLPSTINLYLSKDDFDKQDDDLPAILKLYKKKGLKITWVEDNLKPHKKYIYAFEEYKEKCVITVDDDVFYHDDLIGNLWELHLKYPNSVCSNRIKPIVNQNYEIENYSQWGKKGIKHGNVSFNYLGIGAGGILYPVSLFCKSNVLDVNLIKKCCIMADDLWLKCHEILNGIPVSTNEHHTGSIGIWGSQKESLMSYNCNSSGLGGNDVQWQNLNKLYDINHRLIQLVRKENTPP